MIGRDRSLPFSTAEAFFQVLVRAVRRSYRGLRGRSLLLPALFCIGTCVCFFLIAPAAAAGFVKEDCSCPLSGYSLTSSQPVGTTALGCIWTRQAASSGDRGAITVLVTKYPDRQKALTKIGDKRSLIQSAVNSDKKLFPGYSCVEETYSDTRFSTICAQASSYYGMRYILSRDTYVIELTTPGAQFRSGQELKSSFDQLETCMKKAADAHATGQSGVPSAVTATGTQRIAPGPGTISGRAGTGGTGSGGEEEDSLEEVLGKMGDEINEDLPLPVNWTAVPEAMSNSMVPATAGAFGALVGGSLGSLALFFTGIPWPGSKGGEGGGEPGGQPENADTQGGTEAAGQPVTKPVEMVVGAIAKDRPIDQLGVPPLPGSSFAKGPAQAGVPVPETSTVQGPARIAVPVPGLPDPGRKFCSSCGKPLREGVKFCGNCGAETG